MPVSIKGSGGGGVTLDAGAAASATTLTLPNVSGTVLQSGTAVTVVQGGTGATTLTANNVLLGNGTSALQVVAPGTAGNVLTSNGTTWASTAPASTGNSISNGTSNVSIGSANGSITMQTAGTAAATVDTSQNFQFNSGYGSVATAYGCRAWVNFNGTGTVAIRASGNVTSITDNNTGDYTVNFTTSMPDANYSVVVTGTVTFGSFYGIGAINGNTAPAVGSVRVFSINNVGGAAASDPAYFCVTILR